MTDRDTITRTRARAPGVGGAFHRMAVQYIASTDPTLCGSMLKHEGRRQTDRRSADAGSRLKLIDASGRSRLIRQPFSRNGENSPYGMLGGIEETAASFEARFAPRSYPTRAEVVPRTNDRRRHAAPSLLRAGHDRLETCRIHSTSSVVVRLAVSLFDCG